MTIRIIKHEAVPNCGSFEVRYSDGQPSRRPLNAGFNYAILQGWPWKHERVTGKEAAN
jgi:hypothetical protein